MKPKGKIEKIAVGDLLKRNRTLKVIKHWQKRIWKEGSREG